MKDGDIGINQSERAAQPSTGDLKIAFFFFWKRFKSQHRGDVSQSDFSLQSKRPQPQRCYNNQLLTCRLREPAPSTAQWKGGIRVLVDHP